MKAKRYNKKATQEWGLPFPPHAMNEIREWLMGGAIDVLADLITHESAMLTRNAAGRPVLQITIEPAGFEIEIPLHDVILDPDHPELVTAYTDFLSKIRKRPSRA